MGEPSPREDERDLSRPIVIIGALPPPLSGYSLITSKILELARGYRKVLAFDISPGRAERGLPYHVTRILRVSLAMLRLFSARLDRAREVYIATESRAGLVYTILLGLTARALGYRVFLHHHVFRYINVKSRLMTLLVRATRGHATHIFLCPCMERDFAKLYGDPLSALQLSNAAFVEPPQNHAPSPRSEGEPLRLGFLSNLSREKGLYEFLNLIERAAQEGLSATFVLAGPTRAPQDAEAIRTFQTSLAGPFEYRGAVYGAEKESFYRDIDVFVFPTLYDNEAQPLVLFEAMSYGCAIIAYERGCVAEQVGVHGVVIPPGENGRDVALRTLKDWQQDRRSLALMRANAILSYANGNARAKRVAQRLLGIAKDARSARQLLTGEQVVYDALRWSGGVLLEALFGSPYLSDAYGRALLGAADHAQQPQRLPALVLHAVLTRRFPDTYRRAGVAFIHIPKNAGTSINFALYGRSFGHKSASLLRAMDPHAYSEVESFAVLRDPIERTISAYFHVRSGGGSEVRIHPRWAQRLSHIDSFESYLAYLEENRTNLARLTFVSRPQSHFVCDSRGRVLVNKLFLLGHDDDALAAFVAERGIFPLPRRNWTAQEFLDVSKEQRERIRSLYQDDVKLIEEKFGRSDNVERNGEKPS